MSVSPSQGASIAGALPLQQSTLTIYKLNLHRRVKSHTAASQTCPVNSPDCKTQNQVLASAQRLSTVLEVNDFTHIMLQHTFETTNVLAWLIGIRFLLQDCGGVQFTSLLHGASSTRM